MVNLWNCKLLCTAGLYYKEGGMVGDTASERLIMKGLPGHLKDTLLCVGRHRF